jgi:prepilin-type N-terminal cleavage/methylation domain-containing protein
MSRIFRNDRCQAGFTLVEILVTLIVLAILISIGLSRYQNISDRAKVSVAEMELRDAMRGIAVYQIENDSMSYPTSSMISNHTELIEVIAPFIGSIPDAQDARFTFVSYSADDTSFALVGQARDSRRSTLTGTSRGISITP